MDWSPILSYVVEAARHPTPYLVSLVVGIIINLYGQVLVPWLRKTHPLLALRREYDERRALLAVSVFIGFAFPFIVSLFSGAYAHYEQRHVAARATFPDEKPDPVFRVDLDGRVVRMSARTRQLFGPHEVTASSVLGPALWKEILTAHRAGRTIGTDRVIHYAPTNSWFLVAH